MPLDRSLPEILAVVHDRVKHDIRKCIPATVLSVHPERQTVDVQVAIDWPICDDLGRTYYEPAPSLADIPLGVIRGGGFLVWVPVEPGDSVLLVVSDLAIDVWREGDGSAQAPTFPGTHTLGGAFALPCVAPDAAFFSDPAAPSAAGKVIIGKDGAAAQVRISATDIELGANATDAVALASKVTAELTAIKTTLASLSGAAFGTPYTGPGDIGSSIIKAQ